MHCCLHGNGSPSSECGMTWGTSTESHSLFLQEQKELEQRGNMVRGHTIEQALTISVTLALAGAIHVGIFLLLLSATHDLLQEEDRLRCCEVRTNNL